MPSFLLSGNSFFPPMQSPVNYQATSGSTISLSANQANIYFTNPATIAALTLKMPPSPYAGMLVTVTSLSAITSLTMQTATGGAIAGAPTAAVANTSIRMQFTNGLWTWIKP